MKENVIYVQRFEGKYKFLTNFWPSRIHQDGVEYSTVEHAYQAAKTTDRQLKQRIASCRSAGEARQVANKIPLRPDWREVKLQVMEDLVRQKFTANRSLGADLVSTYPATIIMGNVSGDRFWGVFEGHGQNTLGRILMKIRDEIRDEGKKVTLS